jgi:hypothetical protein
MLHLGKLRQSGAGKALEEIVCEIYESLRGLAINVLGVSLFPSEPGFY